MNRHRPSHAPHVVALALTILAVLAVPLAAVHAESPTGASQPPSEGPTTRLLRRLIAFDTAHPPSGRDGSQSAPTLALAEFLKSQLEPMGAQVTIYRGPRNQSAHFIARLRGDGSKRPVLLAAHADVVPADASQWSSDPFTATVKDGFIHGRGALDFKGGLAVFTRAVMMLAERRVPLARDVILLAEDDEEEADFDTDWLAEHHWSDIDAEFVINEGGWILRGENGEPRLVDITVADKVSVNFRVTARGTPTHSSRPLPFGASAIGRLVAALARLQTADLEPRLTPHTRTAFLALARVSAPPLSADLQTLVETSSPTARAQAAARVVDRSQYPLLMRALVRDTATVTMLDAGVKRNVIPGLAQANVNVRMLPGTTTDDIIARLRALLNDPSIEVAIDSGRADARAYYLNRTGIAPSSTDTPLFHALQTQAKREWPRAEVVAAQFEAGTDAMPWRTRGIPVYGVYPYPVDNETLLRMHGNDERVGIAELEQGTAWIYRTLREVAERR